MPWGDRLRLILNALYRRASSPCQISLPLFLSLSPPLFPTPSSPSVLYIPLLLFLLTITHPSSTLPLYFIHYILCIFFQSLSWFHFELHSRSLLPTSLMMKTFFFFFYLTATTDALTYHSHSTSNRTTPKSLKTNCVLFLVWLMKSWVMWFVEAYLWSCGINCLNHCLLFSRLLLSTITTYKNIWFNLQSLVNIFTFLLLLCLGYLYLI